ncbi:MFS transporter [Desulfovibrio mangrovi]|uniref:MFS transporter n=1 Tax=Desulfovibrio mangrovi TaxID=2976983 RepID=UPI002246BA34|nr:MFS transporter [Desulfovibrio mangrovi]UZP68423.1 MFS transporter [Desulfovibrio mangrovi]
MEEERAFQRATLFVVCVAHFLMPFMMSAVGIALPTMGREFHATAMQMGLVETVYVLSASIFLLSMGRLADMHGRRRLFQLGIALFTVMAGFLAFAWSAEAVIALRFLQGIGGSMVMATSMAMVVNAFPANVRGRALGIAVSSVYAGISCGPFIGGVIVSHWSWRAVFLLCVPLGLAAFLLTTFRLRLEKVTSGKEPFDWKGSIIYATSILVLILGASNLDIGPWAYVSLAIGGIGLVLFVRFESRQPYPLLPVGLFRGNRIFAFSNLAALLNYAATFGVAFFVSLYLQYIKGMTPAQAGTVLMIQSVVQAALSPFCGRLADRYPAANVATLGMILCVAGLALAATVGETTPLWHLYVMLVLLGGGFALFSSPNTTVIMGSIEPAHLGVASGLVASMRTLGMMSSMTIITVVFSMLLGGHAITVETYPAFLRSMQLGLSIFAGLCCLGVFCSLGRLGRKEDVQQAA